MMSKKLASSPPMGWNSWNMFGWKISEEAVLQSADALVSSGLRECGYEYLVIDDCWSLKEKRSPSGDLIPDPEKFPNGIKPIADYCHERGIKLGIYSDASEKTCGGHLGSLGHEEQDAALWASWGVDFLKYDYCGAPNEQEVAIDRYTKMGKALAGTGREILFSLCEWGGRSPWLWGNQAGGQMWRVSGDVFDSWVDIWVPHGPGYYGIGVDHSIDIAAFLGDYGGPGAWNDLDMLVVGLRGKGQIAGGGLSSLEYRTHMSVWCMAASPLMIGCDIRNMDSITSGILMNRDIIAINQDARGVPARRVRTSGRSEIWKKPLADGSVAAMVINRGNAGEDVYLRAGDIGMLDVAKTAHDVWSGEVHDNFTWELKLRVQPHETIVLKVKNV